MSRFSNQFAGRMSMSMVVSGLAAVLLVASWASAVMPITLDQATEADFLTGELSATAVTSSGQICLGRQLTVLMPSQKSPGVISALSLQGKTLLAASGSDNTIYKIQNGKFEKFATISGGTMIGSLLVTDQDMLAGVNGDKGAGIYRLDDKGQAKLFWSSPSVKYVWAILSDGAGKYFAATGPKGEVYAIDAAGKGEVVFAAKDLAKNILCLARAEDGMLYAGTDDNGLVVAIDPRKKTSRVVLDAPEKEISVVIPNADGSLYVATSDAAKAGGETPGEGSDAVERPEAQTMPTTGPNAPAPATQPAKQAAAKTMPATAPAAAAVAPAKPVQDEEDVGEATLEVPAATPAAKPAARAPVPARAPRTTPPVAAAAASAGDSEGGASIEGPGNAVYRIAPDGLVRPVIRRPVSIFTMLRYKDQLILGTGNSGQIISVRLSDEEVAVLADIEASQVTALAIDADGKIYFGSSNKGSVGQLGSNFAKSGTFTSKAIDAQQIAKWGSIRVGADLPAQTGLTVSTRTGNLAEPKDHTWSPWSQETPVTEGFVRIASPAGRYFQYRLKFTSTGSESAVASNVRLVYQIGNLAPEIAAIAVVASATEEGGPATPAGPAAQREHVAAQPMYFRTITVQASDPNADQLTYTFEYRQVGTENWIEVGEKLDKPQFAWDTRTVSDGTYEFRATASDLGSNPPAGALKASKISTSVVVDNTPSVMKDLMAKVDGKTISAAGTATDNGQIATIQYSLDSGTEWTTVLPDDGICDSDSEKFTVEIKDAKPGTHRLTIKATDSYGNTGYGTVTVNVAK